MQATALLTSQKTVQICVTVEEMLSKDVHTNSLF